MRKPVLPVALLAAVLSATTALASGGGWSKPEPTSQPDQPQGTADAASPRHEAERWYGDAFKDVRKGRDDLDHGRTASAEKYFRRARERAERAVALDPKFHEAWNLAGYSARKTGDYKAAFAAYEKCLALKPDYAPAREYVGEAYVEVGDLEHAREQLGWLERLGATDDAKDLRAAIETAAAKQAAGTAPKAPGVTGR